MDTDLQGKAGSGNSDYDYSGLHAFVFIDRIQGRSPAEAVAGLRDLGQPPDGPVFFASEFVGPYLAFAHLWVADESDLSGLQDLITGPLWELGVHCQYCVEADVFTGTEDGEAVKKGTKRATPEVIALVSIVVQRGMVGDVLQALGEVPHFKGASVVTGDFDILMQLGGNDLTELLETALTSLQDIEGIVHTSTAFADGTR